MLYMANLKAPQPLKGGLKLISYHLSFVTCYCLYLYPLDRLFFFDLNP
jgi:hypothetical protein